MTFSNTLMLAQLLVFYFSLPQEGSFCQDTAKTEGPEEALMGNLTLIYPISDLWFSQSAQGKASGVPNASWEQ